MAVLLLAMIVCLVALAARPGILGALLLWILLLLLCPPLAILLLVLYPIVWLVLLPLRLVGLAAEGVLALLRSVLLLPARLFGAVGR